MYSGCILHLEVPEAHDRQQFHGEQWMVNLLSLLGLDSKLLEVLFLYVPRSDRFLRIHRIP